MPHSSSCLIKRHAYLEEIDPVAWDDLAGRAAGSTIFQGYGWNACWWKFKQTRVMSLVLISVWRQRTMVGLAPLYFERPPGGHEGILRFLGQGDSDYLDFIVDRDAPEAVEALLEAIQSLPEPWSTSELSELPPWSALGPFLEESIGTGRRAVERLRSTPCPGFRIAGNEDAFIGLTRKSSLKRHTSKLGSLGRLEVRHLEGSEEILPRLDGFFQQHIDRWAVTPSPSLFLQEQNRAFYRCLVATLAPSHQVLLSVLSVSGRAAAFHFGFQHRRHFIFYKPSFDIRLFRCGPGEVLLKELFLYCLERGFHQFDFTRGDEKYKYRFSDHRDENANFILYRRASELTRRRFRRSISGGVSNLLRAAGLLPLLQAARRRLLPPGGPGTASPGALFRNAVSGLLKTERLVRCEPGAELAQHRPDEQDLDFLLGASGFDDEGERSRFLQSAYEHFKKRHRCLVRREGQVLRGCLWLASTAPPPSAETEDPTTSGLQIVGLELRNPRDRDGTRIDLIRDAGALARQEGRSLIAPLDGGVTLEVLSRAGLAPEVTHEHWRTLGRSPLAGARDSGGNKPNPR